MQAISAHPTNRVPQNKRAARTFRWGPPSREPSREESQDAIIMCDHSMKIFDNRQRRSVYSQRNCLGRYRDTCNDQTSFGFSLCARLAYVDSPKWKMI